jgi:hypothetical protein
MTIDKVLNLLTNAQQELAIAALRTPNSHDAFEYGRMVGMYAGIERAIEVILSTIKEDNNDV